MAAERLNVRSVREILRLHFSIGQSPRQIAKQGYKRRTVRDYIERANKFGLTNWDEIEPLPEQELERRLGFKLITGMTWLAKDKSMPDWQAVHRDFTTHKHVTLALLWQEYLEQNPSGYQYTQFCTHYRRWSKKLSVVMRQEHKAGEKGFVDYCDGIAITDRETGAKTETELFVGCLGASSYTYAEATLTQGLKDWIQSHVRMYAFFGGVPEITVPDNLRSGVKKPCFYEPIINESYREMAGHYGTAIIPAHVRKPKHKAKVEANVLVAQRWILACLRHHVFYSLQELNDAIALLLEKLNLRKMRILKKSRRELFEELDKGALKPLPAREYEFAEWEKVKVNIDYHIEFDEHYYSVHYTRVHQEMMCRATAAAIEIFFKGERVASHRRSYVKRKYTTLPEHRPESHKAMMKWPPSRLIAWGTSIGPSVGLLVEKILSSRKHPEQAYRSAMGLIRLGSGKKYEIARVEKSCRRALELGAHSYQFVANCLKNNMDKLIAEEDKQLSLQPRSESNTRGREYYH